MSDIPILPYAGTSGHSGSDTSRERAIDADKSGVTKLRQQKAIDYLSTWRNYGATWKDLSMTLGWHHGTASGTLSVLHKAGKIERLKETRDRCKIYVLSEYVEDRPVERFGGKHTSRREIIREIQAFAGDYAHNINGRDVVIVDQLLDFLRTRP